jgi:hypothetical protein
MRNKHIISGLLVLCVVGLAFYYRHDVITALQDIQTSWAIAGFFCIFTNYCFRALRLYVLTDGRLNVWPDGIYCTSMHGFATYMLPLRSGDLSLPFLLKATAAIELKEGALVLFKARLLEVFTLGIWFVVASIFPSSILPAPIIIAIALSGVLMMLSPLILKKLFGLSILPFDIVRRTAKKLSQTSRMRLREILLTIGIWISIALGLWCVTVAIQLPLPFMDVFFLIALQLAMQLMPVQGFANSGNHESGWAGALILMGHPADAALKFALTSHAIILVYVLFLGLIALALRYTVVK